MWRGMEQVASEWPGMTDPGRRARLADVANPLLAARDIPSVTVVKDPPQSAGNQAEFDYKQWAIRIDPALLQQASLDPKAVAQLTELVRHEAEHALQWWSMARMRASQGADPAQIIAEMHGLDPQAAQHAYDTVKRDGMSKAEQAAAQVWWDSVYSPTSSRNAEPRPAQGVPRAVRPAGRGGQGGRGPGRDRRSGQAARARPRAGRRRRLRGPLPRAAGGDPRVSEGPGGRRRGAPPAGAARGRPRARRGGRGEEGRGGRRAGAQAGRGPLPRADRRGRAAGRGAGRRARAPARPAQPPARAHAASCRTSSRPRRSGARRGGGVDHRRRHARRGGRRRAAPTPRRRRPRGRRRRRALGRDRRRGAGDGRRQLHPRRKRQEAARTPWTSSPRRSGARWRIAEDLAERQRQARRNGGACADDSQSRGSRTRAPVRGPSGATSPARRRAQEGDRPRTELATAVPPPGEPFIAWFDSLTLAELDTRLADLSTDTHVGAEQVIERQHPPPGHLPRVADGGRGAQGQGVGRLHAHRPPGPLVHGGDDGAPLPPRGRRLWDVPRASSAG